MNPPASIPDDDMICAMDGPALARLALQIGLAPANAFLTPEGVEYVPDAEPQHSLWEPEPWMPWRSLCWEQAHEILYRLRGYGWDIELVLPASTGGGLLTCHFCGDGPALQLQLYGSWIEEEPMAILCTAVRAQCMQLRDYHGD